MTRGEAGNGLRVWDLPRGVNAVKTRDAKAAQRARLFYAMTECIARKGFARTSVEDVLKIAKVSRRTFYQLFRDKEACYLSLFERAHESLVQAVLDSQQGATTWQQHLECSHRAYLEFFVDHPKLARTLLVEVIAAGPNALRQRARYHARFTRLQRNLYGIRRKEYPSLPDLPDEAFSVLIAGIDDLVARYVREGRSKSLQKLEATVLYLVSAVHGAPILMGGLKRS